MPHWFPSRKVRSEAATNAGGSGPGTVVAESSGPGSAAALVTTTATVTAINQKTRMVTLHTADGENITFKADESIRNLPQVHKGDVVTTSYYESLAVSVREVKGGKPSITTTEEVQRAPLGSMPAGVVVRREPLAQLPLHLVELADVLQRLLGLVRRG